jgi:hypothetical protein
MPATGGPPTHTGGDGHTAGGGTAGALKASATTADAWNRSSWVLRSTRSGSATADAVAQFAAHTDRPADPGSGTLTGYTATASPGDAPCTSTRAVS